MVHHQRLHFHQHRKGGADQLEPLLDSTESHHPSHLTYYEFCATGKTAKPTLLSLFRICLLISLVSFSLIFGLRLLMDHFSYYSLGEDDIVEIYRSIQERNRLRPCRSMVNNTICCDRSSLRTDVCYMKGDVRTHASSNSILLHFNCTTTSPVEERIKPYTRKWETSVMATIDELRLRTDSDPASHCDVRHNVPAIVFSTGGYTGNVYHEFNDGILPLYITAQSYDRKVVIVLLEYHDWWITKYAEVLARLSDHPPIDFSSDRRIHCFPEATVGLRIHDELTIDPYQMEDNKTIRDFRQLLDEAYKPRVRWLPKEQTQQSPKQEKYFAAARKLKLVIVSRNGSRAIENEGELARLGEEVGFRVQVLRPARTTELASIYRAVNACDAMVGVHGAAMTHFLFMRPGSVFIQIVPLGTDWAADAYYGEPARKMGLRYVGYKIVRRESSLYTKYERNHPVLRDPDSVNARGWDFTKKVYLDEQNVRLDLDRFRKLLAQAHKYLLSGRRAEGQQKVSTRKVSPEGYIHSCNCVEICKGSWCR